MLYCNNMLILAGLVTAGFSLGALNWIALDLIVSFMQRLENDEK